jgi:hypothetical protein
MSIRNVGNRLYILTNQDELPFYYKYGGNMLLRNVSNDLPQYLVPHLIMVSYSTLNTDTVHTTETSIMMRLHDDTPQTDY